jgi:hypothetical protein
VFIDTIPSGYLMKEESESEWSASSSDVGTEELGITEALL